MWRPFSKAIEIRQSIGGGCAYEGQGEESQGYDDRGRSARSPVKCRRLVFRVLFFMQCLSHLRSLRCQVSRKISSPWTNKRAVAWTIQRRLLRSCLPKVVLNHGLIWLINCYLISALRARPSVGGFASCVIGAGASWACPPGAAPFEIVFEGFAVTPAYVDRKLAPKHGSVRSHPKEANEFEPNHFLLNSHQPLLCQNSSR